jgi:hypothetical protein
VPTLKLNDAEWKTLMEALNHAVDDLYYEIKDRPGDPEDFVRRRKKLHDWERVLKRASAAKVKQ